MASRELALDEERSVTADGVSELPVSECGMTGDIFRQLSGLAFDVETSGGLRSKDIS